jgi:mono/diheme cytochrome c family protein
MLNIIGLVMLIAVAALLAWSCGRAWRLKNSLLRWGGVSLAALLAAVVSLVSAVTIAGLFKLHARDAPVPYLKVAGTPQQIERGHGIADSFCDACHSDTGTLTGGVDIGKEFPIPVGSFVSSNLTPAGQLSRWSDGEIFRAIRNSVDADGHWLMIMSYTNAGKLSDDDIAALIAYIRTRPAAGRQTATLRTRSTCWGSSCWVRACSREASLYSRASRRHPQRALRCNMANISCRIRIAANATVPI